MKVYFSQVFRKLQDGVRYTFVLPSGERLKGFWYNDHILDLYLRFKYSECDFDLANNTIAVLNEI